MWSTVVTLKKIPLKHLDFHAYHGKKKSHEIVSFSLEFSRSRFSILVFLTISIILCRYRI